MDATSAEVKSWVTFSPAELEEVATTGLLPPNFSWDDLVEHPEFEALFKYRDDPAKLASMLLPKVSQEKVKRQYVPALSPEYRHERLKLKKRELEIQEHRMKISSILLDKTRSIETKVNTICDYLERLDKHIIAIEEILHELRVRARIPRG